MGSSGRGRVVLAALFLATFAMGCSELLAVGLPYLIAAGLRVSVPATGSLVTVNALGLAVGGPVLTALTVKLDKRPVLIAALLAFIVATLAPVIVPDYRLFLATRTVAGALQGLFIAAAFVVGSSMVPRERVGRAISVVVSGFAVSAALGLPLGALLGQAFGWRGSFLVVIALATAALVALAALAPPAPRGSGSHVVGQIRHALAPRVLAVLSLHLLVFAAVDAVLTYIVPFLRQVTGVSAPAISLFLFAYGAATAVGSFGGGRFADRNAGRALIVGTIGTAGSLLALHLFGGRPALAAVIMVIWGLFAFGMVPSLQYRVVSLAGPGGELASSLPASAVNAGIAVGSAAGGATIGAFGVTAIAVTGALIAAISVVVALLTSVLRPPVTPPHSASTTADPAAHLVLETSNQT